MREHICCDWRRDVIGGERRIALTCGDINGIGLEILRKALRIIDRGGLRLTVLGPGAILRRELRGLPVEIVDCGPAKVEMRAGEVTAEAGEAAFRAVKSAAEETFKGNFDALVTAPLSKKALNLAGHNFPGHTEILQEICGSEEVLMMFLSENLIIGLLTTHIALQKAPEALTIQGVVGKLRIMQKELRERMGFEFPKIALCAFNPHAGEEGMFGDEEIRILQPAAAAARAEGIEVSDPLPADTLFARTRGYDAVMAVYHDQGLIPAKMAPGGSVNFTGGLPIIRTSPDHGTAFDIAGRDKADPSGMVKAIEWALRLCR